MVERLAATPADLSPIIRSVDKYGYLSKRDDAQRSNDWKPRLFVLKVFAELVNFTHLPAPSSPARVYISSLSNVVYQDSRLQCFRDEFSLKPKKILYLTPATVFLKTAILNYSMQIVTTDKVTFPRLTHRSECRAS